MVIYCVILSLVIKIIIILVHVLHCCHIIVIGLSETQRQESTDVIEIQACGAYDIIQLSKQRITMDENAAYGQVGVIL